ncbi:hypothetical protein PLICRDRAFT_46817 [Plicaturopsis crispa FD-325 SS-3]|uniref:C2H2-type domain-containing protein n=1 Tax=Plicaturopsis crispa FD-325 SS-3 TaxID=944288 RepID=A0A0C9SKM9_PLICR|nr:hypothetical protein PLICRDRAFT_46817 [Plicaturopsis crispa FD-325 SS-3]
MSVPSLNSFPDDGAALSLLSLSIAASNAQPIPVAASTEPAVTTAGAGLSTSVGAAGLKHRRLSSTGAARRRMSDARDAATRPSPASLQTAANTLSSMASLSLSSTPPSNVEAESEAGDIKLGKKRGTIFTCESCSKVYRHPSCLIKHRWEHAPQWREASKFVLSKHQQVQLLEAAAILSHLSPDSATGTSLPEDRSLWPSFLSDGQLPPPTGSTPSSVPTKQIARSPAPHDYALPASQITEVRPGLLSVPTRSPAPVPIGSPASAPVPIASPHTQAKPHAEFYRYGSHQSYGGASYGSVSQSYGSAGYGSAVSQSYTRSDGTGWSLPRSSLRSVSDSSRSRSGSGSRSDDEDGDADYGFLKREDDDLSVGFSVREEDEEESGAGDGDGVRAKSTAGWDGMEMEMEMD